MADYEFVTTWHLDAPPGEVFAVIVDAPHWPEWWPSVRSVRQIEAGDANGIGTIHRYEFEGWLPYTLIFDVRATVIDPPRALDGIASGELEGIGQWRLEPDGGGTVVTYRWAVATTRWWMNVLSPVLRPVFVANHGTVMRSGEQGLRRTLASRSMTGSSAPRDASSAG